MVVLIADNTRINPGAAGDIVRDVDRAGVKTQIMGLDVDPAGPGERLAGLGNELAVTGANDQLVLLELRRISTLLSIIAGTTVSDFELLTEVS